MQKLTLFSRIAVSLILVGLPILSVAKVRALSANLITNPSVEAASSSDPAAPAGWYGDSWGANTSTFTYSSTAHTGARSLRVDVNNYTSGDAKWFADPVAVSPNTQYSFSDWYLSSVWTDVLVQYRSTTGAYSYRWIAGGNSTNAWRQLTGTFTTPANVQSVTILHLIQEVGFVQTDDYSLGVYQPAAPTVAITNPMGGSTLTGSLDVTASATEAAGVQFKLDGADLGSEDITAPYSTTWNTTTVPDGTHHLTAVARGATGLTTTSSAIDIIVHNTAPSSGQNVIPNASVEVAGTPTNLPSEWTNARAKNNDAIFNYLKTGHSGSRSVRVKITDYTDGDAYWAHNPQLVEGGRTYEFSDWYKATAPTNVYANIVMQDGSEQWINVGLTAVVSPGWSKFYTQFTMPIGARTAVVYHSLAAVGTLTTDDYQLNIFTPQGFTRGLITLTFDDGIRSIYTYGLPELQKYGFKSTQYLISGTTEDAYYMDEPMMAAFAQAGHEIASHTVTHPHLPNLTSSQRNSELKNSQLDLQAITGVKPTNFASPYGEANSTVLNGIKKYYASQRGVETGFNSKNNFDIWDIKVQDVIASTTVQDIARWAEQARDQRTWLVLVYHATDPDTTIPDAEWNTTPVELDAQFQAIKNTGTPVVTVKQALAELTPQL